MAIIVRCDCGKRMQVKDESAGKTCRCPGCGERLTIPPAGSEKLTTSRKKKPSLTKTVTVKSAPSEETDDDAVAPKGKNGDRPKSKRKRAEQRVLWPWIAGGSVALALIVGVSLWLVFRKPAKEPDKGSTASNKAVVNDPVPVKANAPPANDFDLIPADAPGFLAIQLGKWWESAPGKKLQQQIAQLAPNDLVEQAIGVTPDVVQRVLIVFAESSLCTIVSTNAPVQRDKVLGKIAPKAVVRQQSGNSYHVAAQEQAVHFFNDRLYAFGNLRSLSGLVEHPRSTKSGGLAESLSLTEKHLAVLAINPDANEVQMVKQELPDEVKAYAALLQARKASLTLDIDEDLKIHVSLSMPDAAQAGTAKAQVQTLITLARAAVTQLKKDGPPEQKEVMGPAFVLIDSLLRTVKAEQRDTVVDVDLQTENGVFTAQVAILIPVVQRVREAAQGTIDQNNLKQIALAMHNNHDAYGALPAGAICGPDGKPLLSWRVAILPFIEQGNLYNEFHLNESWDSPHNIKLLEKMPAVYSSPTAVGDKPFTTHYRVFTGDQAAFPERSKVLGPKQCIGRRLTDFTDGTSNTLLVVESANAVEWTKPDDLPYSPQTPLPKLGVRESGFNAAFADGSVRFFARMMLDEKTLRALITPAGGEVFQLP